MKTKSSYSFEDRGTDRRNRFRNVLSMTFWMIYMTRLSMLKINLRQQKQYTSPVTLGGGIIKDLEIKINRNQKQTE